MIVAIDGPAGSGKSTVAREIARRRGLCYLDTGAMFRSVTWAALEAGISVSDEASLAELARTIDIHFEQDTSASAFAQRTFVGTTDVSAAIRTPEVDRNVSAVSAVPAVREALLTQQRRVAEASSLVAEGRDIGTQVFPQAEVKVFLTADASARAHRRAVERAGGNAANQDQTTDAAEEQQILADLKRRDELDSTREVAPLKPAPDAVHIDSSTLTVDEVCRKIEVLIDQAAATPAATPAKADKPIEQAKSAASKAADKPKKRGKMAAWGNKEEDYYEHTVREFPLFTRVCLKLVVCIVWLLTKLLFRWRVEDGRKVLEACKGQKQGAVVIMNHVSMLDPILIAVYLILHGVSIRPIYKSEWDDTRLMQKLLTWAGGIPVNRGEADIKAVRRATRALKAGESVLIYPEGTRVRSDDQDVKIHGGFALIAHMGGAKVVPVAIVGARQVKPQGARFMRPVTVHLKAGDALSFDELEAKGRKQQLEAMEVQAVARMFQLRDELRQSWPGKE